MRPAARLIIAFLLCFFLQSCHTAKKATLKEEARLETATEITTTQASETTGAAFFNQAILDSIRNSYNIVIDFERWEYAPEEGARASPDSLQADNGRPASDRTKPPNAGRLTAVTKGTVTITGEGRQSRATQTQAGALVNQRDTTATTAAEQATAERKTEAREERKTSNRWGLAAFFLLLIAGAAAYFAYTFFVKPRK